MRKEFKEKLEQFIEAINKDIVDLDKQYIKDNYPEIDIESIKKLEPQHFDERHYVYNQLVKQRSDILGRFQVAHKIVNSRGNLVCFVVLDRKRNPLLLLEPLSWDEIIDKLPNAYLNWHPLKGRAGWYYPNDVMTWVNNTLVQMRCETDGN